MKIAHVVRRLSFDDWGGTEQVVWNLARAQKAAGHDVRVFATTALCPVEREVRDGIEVFRFRPVYPWWPMPRRLVAELDRKGGNPFVPGLGRALREWSPDVVHCHAMARIAELCLRVASRMSRVEGRKIRSVISLHGGGALVPEDEAASLRAPTRHRVPWGKALDIALRRVRRVPEDFDGIVCVGADEADYWRARHPHVLFLPNGVDTALFSGSVREDRSGDLAVRRSVGPTVLCVARIDRQKNQLALVEALSRNPGFFLRLVGPVTQPDYLELIRRRADELGVSGRVAVVGPLSPGSPELAAEYRAADAFALASRHEPFGIAVLEAWAAGVPVAAARVGGLARLCEANPGAAVVFDPAAAPSSPESLDSALRRVLSPDFDRAAAIAAGRAAAARHDWRALSSELLGFYAAL